MKKAYIFLFIPVALIVSLSLPYLLAFLIGKMNPYLSSLLDTEKYIPMATSIFTFLATIILSLSVYNSNQKKVFTEGRADAFEFICFLNGALVDIESLYNNWPGSFDIEEKPKDYIKIVCRFELSGKQIETLRNTLQDIRAIAETKNRTERRWKCEDFHAQPERIDECKRIIAILAHKYKLGNNFVVGRHNNECNE